MSYRLPILCSVLLVFLPLTLTAAEKHSEHTTGMSHNAVSTGVGQPQEGGQAVFAALIEMVAILEQDPTTDWETVDIDGLRLHLLDMNHLILDTESTKSVLGDHQIRFDVRGTDASIASIHRMVPAHSRFIEQSRGWTINSELTENGATLTIEVKDTALLNRLDALGFYGFMSLDSHHQAHHYQMAVGRSH